MKNREKYKTRELLEEFYKFLEKRCGSGTCRGCEVRDLCDDLGYDGIFVGWLELEAEEEKPLPCPFCGGECNVIGDVNHRVKCTSCNYESIMDSDRDKVVAAHNRVCRAVMAAKEGEVK